MDNILDRIIATKRREVEILKQRLPFNELIRKLDKINRTANSLSTQLLSTPGIIAEFKRASPSKGVINANVSVEQIIKGYDANGAAGISVLTDHDYFQAHVQDFELACYFTNKPILRKEFIIDEYQLYQSNAMGADVVLLIAAVLLKEEIAQFTKTAQSLDLEVFIELHDAIEIDKLCGNEDIIGINNRNLKTFEVNINHSILLKNKLGAIGSVPLISESGLRSIDEIEILYQEGFSGFLIGEHFMKQSDPVLAFTKLNSQIQKMDL